MFDFDLLKNLACACAPSGFESSVCEIIISRLRNAGIRASLSPDGSVAVVIPSGTSSSGKLMLQAHTDEVGFMVKSHTDSGFLKLAPLGIRDSRLLTGRRVTVMGKNGPLHGFIGAVPIHLSKDGKRFLHTVIFTWILELKPKKKLKSSSESELSVVLSLILSISVQITGTSNPRLSAAEPLVPCFLKQQDISLHMTILYHTTYTLPSLREAS